MASHSSPEGVGQLAGQGRPRRTTDSALGPQLGQNRMGPARRR